MNNDRIYYSHEAQVSAMREMTRLMLACLALGVGAGVALALFFAPTSGQKIRDRLTKTVEEGLNTGQETLGPIVKRVEKEFGELGQTVKEHTRS